MERTPTSLLEHLCLNNQTEIVLTSKAEGQSHSPIITVTVSIRGMEGISASASAAQLKQAKHMASNLVLKQLKEMRNEMQWKFLEDLDSWDCNEWTRLKSIPSPPPEDTVNYIGALHEWSSRMRHISPHFEPRTLPDKDASPEVREFEVDCILYNMYDKDGEFLKTTAKSKKMKVSRTTAAKMMVHLLSSMGHDVFSRDVQPQENDNSNDRQ